MESKKPTEPERKKWDKGDFAAKAREKDQQAYQHAKARDAAAAEGARGHTSAALAIPNQSCSRQPCLLDRQPPHPFPRHPLAPHVPPPHHGSPANPSLSPGKRYRPDQDLPRPTGLAQQHVNLGLDKDIGKTMLVSQTTTGKGPRGAGFYCDLCNRTLKDSLSYLDHLNSRFHLSKLGQGTHVARSTVEQVRQRIAELREQTKNKVDAKNYDFAKRLAVVRGAEEAKRQARKDERKKRKEKEREKDKMGKVGVLDASDRGAVGAAVDEQMSMEAMMGFGGFGSGKKR
ncbi:uncharacterized protein EHS24_006656 [Apiotrichum porosum]|uniref:C2H2-type domain-containing protein n=1 Tax=Apiotrichum porosum TaxID=105984 RepID=A0A427Y1N3_9TREE|nr:uncharacterized protein EHS24_006656 [Apiotrichum porosum]RSH85066.1 hypothetical protein EHS24_006656 [Apiotrichum porosum]